MKKTVLIFGVSSFVGSNLAEVLRTKYRVIGTYCKTTVDIPGVLTMSCDVLEKDRVNFIISTFRPNYVVYAVGLRSIELCQKNDKLADALNTGGLVNVADCAERVKAKTVYLSTDFVFSGHEELYQEKDNPDPNTGHGKSKVGAEFYVQKSCLNYLIIRSCPLYGRGINPRDYNWFEMLEKKIGESESFALDNVVHNGFLDVYYLASVLRLCFEKEITNRLLQLSSKDIMTRYQFAQKYCEVFNAQSSLVTKGSWYFPEIDYISADKHVPGEDYYYQMSFDNLESLLSIELPSVEESLQFTYRRFGGRIHKGNQDSSSDLITYI